MICKYDLTFLIGDDGFGTYKLGLGALALGINGTPFPLIWLPGDAA